MSSWGVDREEGRERGIKGGFVRRTERVTVRDKENRGRITGSKMGGSEDIA